MLSLKKKKNWSLRSGEMTHMAACLKIQATIGSVVRPVACSELKVHQVAKHHKRQRDNTTKLEVWQNIWAPMSLSTSAVWVLGTRLTDLARDYSRGLASQVNLVCSRVRTWASDPNKQNQSNLHGGNRLPLRVTGRRRRRRTEVKDSLLDQSCFFTDFIWLMLKPRQQS